MPAPDRDRWRHRRRGLNRGERASVIFAALGSGLALTGVQSVLPVLPAIQEALRLSDGQVSLISSVYLLPAVLFAVPSGLLADRLGRRVVYCAAMTVFGAADLVLLGWRSLPVLLAGRAVQGVAFAALLPLSITMVADVRTGAEGVRLQGYRSVAMSTFDAALPIVGGVLAAVAWYAPFALQVLTLPVAAAAWLVLPPDRERVRRQQVDRPRGGLVHALLRRDALPLHAGALSRFLLKFGVLTYWPLVAARGGMSAVAVGVVLGVSAFLGTIAAGLAGALTRFASAKRWMVTSLAAIAVALTGIATLPAVAASAVAVLLFGAGDGLFGVHVNSFVAEVGDSASRATIVSVNGTMRNLGKFLAPALMGVLVLVVPLGFAFGVLALVAVATMAAVVPLPSTAVQAPVAAEPPM